MDLVEYDTWKGIWLPLLLFIVSLLIVSVLLIFSLKFKSFWLVITSVFICALGFLIGIFSITDAHEESRSQAAIELNEIYGTNLDQIDMYHLKYPSYVPKENRVLGTLSDEAIADGMPMSDEISLVWNDGKIKLFQQTGAGVSEEMPRVK